MNKEELERQCRYANEVVGNLNTLDGIKCETCLNRGYVNKIDETYNVVYVETCPECGYKRYVAKIVKQSGLDAIAQQYTFDNFTTNESWQGHVKEKALSYVKEDFKTNWFFIGGESGSGKTMICTAITMELLKKGKKAHYMLWRDEIMKIKGMTMTPEYHDLIHQLQTVPVLYIDDFLKSNGTPTASDLDNAYLIINARYNTNRTTIISSEYALAQIESFEKKIDSLGGAISGRIHERAVKYEINLQQDGKRNYRKKGK